MYHHNHPRSPEISTHTTGPTLPNRPNQPTNQTIGTELTIGTQLPAHPVELPERTQVATGRACRTSHPTPANVHAARAGDRDGERNRGSAEDTGG